MHVRMILVLALGAVGAGCGASATSTQTATVETATEQTLATVSIDEVATAIDQHDTSIAFFDANSRETYAEHHVPGATWVQYDAVAAASLPADHNTKLVFYCGNEQCHASHTAAEQARAHGYNNVAVMSAGIRGWIAAGKPTESSPAPEASAN